jgi:hypothetical protein
MAGFTFAVQAVSAGIDPLMWVGVAGERPAGIEIAEHLEATARLLQRADSEPTFDRSLSTVMRAARAEGVGSEDTQVVGKDLMEHVLRIHLRAPYAQVDAWSESPKRQPGDVLALLTASAELARRYGPTKVVR